MSDVEDYAYSPYDDLEDILWDADPAPELADDLADHAIHSPVYQDEDAVKNELQDYFSDWEYYSDDFMDDDPALLRKNPLDGGPLKTKKNVKRGKKRKLVETQDIPSLDLDDDQLLTRCIKGTIWAKPTELNTPSYKDGQEKKVALMKDWKQIFAFKENGWGRKSAKEDESWANDMSLADMGLQNLPRQSSYEQNSKEAEDEFEEENEDEEDDAEEMMADLQEEAMSSHGHSEADLSRLRSPVPLEEDGGGGESAPSLPVSEVDEDIPRKRRRVEPEAPPHSKSHEAVAVAAESVEPKVDAGQSPNIDAFEANGNECLRPKAPVSGGGNNVHKKKRKAEDEPHIGETKLSASSRAKRVASSAAGVTQSVSQTSSTRRSTRAK